MTATHEDLRAITDQLRAAVRPDIKISVKTVMFNPFDGTPEREHYAVSADIGDNENGFTLHDWYPATDTPDDVVAAALRMIRHPRPAPSAGDTIEYEGNEILVQFIEVTAQGDWRILGRIIEGEDIEKLADVLVTPFDWEQA